MHCSPRTEQTRCKYSGEHNITLDSADYLLAFPTRLQLCASFVIRFVFVVATTAKQKSDSESKKPTLRYVGVWINFTNFREVWVTVSHQFSVSEYQPQTVYVYVYTNFSSDMRLVLTPAHTHTHTHTHTHSQQKGSLRVVALGEAPECAVAPSYENAQDFLHQHLYGDRHKRIPGATLY